MEQVPFHLLVVSEFFPAYWCTSKIIRIVIKSVKIFALDTNRGIGVKTYEVKKFLVKMIKLQEFNY